MEKELQFIEWESKVFGAGYGTGELPIMKSVKIFFECFNNNSYDHEILEKALGDSVTWLLINLFNHYNIIEWGTSARYGWLTSSGEYVRDFIKDKTPEELYELLMTDHEPVCMCEGSIKDKGHENCGKNPMINEKYANQIKYGKI
jgi:hypothetical protein